MQTQDVIKLLDEVLSGLDQATRQTANGPAGLTTPAAAVPSAASAAAQAPAPLADAIDREINAAGRQTAIVSLRDSDAADQFRRELETESLTVTTVTSLLQLVREALQIFGTIAA